VGREEQLRWERDNARWAAAAAVISGILTLAAGLYVRSKVQSSSGDDTVDQIKLVHAHKNDLLIGSILQAIGTALLAAPLYYLFRATRFRREQLPGGIRWLVLIAPVLGAVTSVIHQIQTSNLANKIVAELPLEVKIADNRIKDEVGHGAVVVVGGIGTAAALGIAFMFILVSLNAMRAGLLSRFMGIVGMIVGVLLVIPLQGNLPVVQVFWIGALAALVLNRWPPPGRGPAWDAGEAIPWPSAADRRDELSGGGGEPRPARGGWGAASRQRAAASAAADDGGNGASDEPSATQHTREAPRPRPSSDAHPRSKKRKRKRRG
jgi:hypothetical protein